MKNQLTTTQKLIQFVNQRPGLDFANYGDRKTYQSEVREITKDRNDFFELLAWAQSRIADFDKKLTTELKNSSGRLTLKGDSLEYVPGQYWPTEYRPAAARVVANLLWADLRDEKEKGQPVYTDGHAMRKAASRNLSRRVTKNYFS